VAGSAAWAGALVGLVLAGPVRRLVRLAAAGVLLLAVTGVVRAFYELLSLSQLWDTGYGRTLLVKTGILLVALALGLLLRARIRRRAALELALAAGLLVAVAVLVLQTPGRNVAAAVAAPPAAPTGPSPPPARPPPGAVVTAQELGIYGVALAAEPRRLTAIVLSPAGGGLSGADVTIDGRAAAPCGQGCYRVAERAGQTVQVEVNGVTGAFSPHLGAPPADALVRRLRARFRAYHSVEYVEHLASDPAHALTADWRLVAPDSLAYDIAGGASAIVIGRTRWDRDPGSSTWTRSPQTPLTMPAPQWEHESDAHLLAPGTVTFLDPSVPAYFRLDFDPHTLQPSLLRMTAAAHFMTDRYVRFDSVPALHPPP